MQTISPDVLEKANLVLTEAEVPSVISQGQAREAAVGAENLGYVLESVYAHCRHGTPGTLTFVDQPCWVINVGASPSATVYPPPLTDPPSGYSPTPRRLDYNLTLVDATTGRVLGGIGGTLTSIDG
jgi:hypothetical protein